MSYFDTATMTISEIGGYGDYELPTDEFARDDRGKRIDCAAGALCDWTYEHLLDAGELGDEGIFKQAHLPRIQRMVADRDDGAVRARPGDGGSPHRGAVERE